MKIAVLGASGGCGQQLVALAQHQGHEVSAVVRSATWQAPAGIRVLRGDLTNETFLRDAVRGHEVVLSALGLRLPGLAPWKKPQHPEFLVRSTQAVLAAMKAEGLKRLLAISAGGVGDSYEKMTGILKAMIRLTALRIPFRELAKMESAMLSSGLDVCICRPSGLTNGPVTGKVTIAHEFVGRATISRADVAAWMLGQLEKPVFTDKTPLITVTGVA